MMTVPSAIVFHESLDPDALSDEEERAEVEANIADLCRPYGQIQAVHSGNPGQEDAGLVYVQFAAPSQVCTWAIGDLVVYVRA
jgi:hypothetical protein